MSDQTPAEALRLLVDINWTAVQLMSTDQKKDIDEIDQAITTLCVALGLPPQEFTW